MTWNLEIHARNFYRKLPANGVYAKSRFSPNSIHCNILTLWHIFKRWFRNYKSNFSISEANDFNHSSIGSVIFFQQFDYRLKVHLETFDRMNIVNIENRNFAVENVILKDLKKAKRNCNSNHISNFDTSKLIK